VFPQNIPLGNPTNSKGTGIKIMYKFVASYTQDACRDALHIPYCFPVSTKTWICEHFRKLPNIKFHENRSAGLELFHVVKQRSMANLNGTFFQFFVVNTPNININDIYISFLM
jgi:hypothetical protein